MFFLFFILINSFLLAENIYYNSVIEVVINKDTTNLQKELKKILSEKANNENLIKITSSNSNEIKNDGKGFSMYHNADLNKKSYVIAEKILERNLEGIAGIPIFYYGFEVITNKNGYAILPNKQSERKLNILITLDIEPKISPSNNKIPRGFNLKKENPSFKYFEYEGYLIDDGKIKWIMHEIINPDLKEVNKPSTLIIFTDPNKVYFETEEVCKIDTNECSLKEPSLLIKNSNNIILPNLKAMNNFLLITPIDLSLNEIIKYHYPLYSEFKYKNNIEKNENNKNDSINERLGSRFINYQIS